MCVSVLWGCVSSDEVGDLCRNFDLHWFWDLDEESKSVKWSEGTVCEWDSDLSE